MAASPKDRRSFTAVWGTEEAGRYMSTTPAGAARKAASRYFKLNESEAGAEVDVAVRETTRCSRSYDKVWEYSAVREAIDPTKITLGDTKVQFKFKTVVRAVRRA
jgi:urease gamma subunit